MSKRLKRRIQEICGLTSLKKEERAKRAQQILSDTNEKQAICHQIIGASYKDIEKALRSIVDDKRPSYEEEFEQEHFQEEPVKPSKPQRNVTTIPMEQLLDQDEVNALLSESSMSIVEQRSEYTDRGDYETYSFEEVAALLEGTYHPAMFRRRK